MSAKDVQDFQAASVAAGAGQRVNPGFFDSRNRVGPDVLARAKAFNPGAFKSNRRGGIMDFITGGGILGNLIRGVGQKFGLGKTYDQATYDMSEFSPYGLGGSQNPSYYDDFENEFVEDEEVETITLPNGMIVPKKKPIRQYIEPIPPTFTEELLEDEDSLSP